MSELQRAVIVTGGAYGIGRGICRLFAARGWRVFIADINEERGRDLERELPGARFVATDVRDESSLMRLMVTVVGDTGRLDALVNNAGIEKYAAPEEFTLADWDAIVGVNLRGVFLGSRLAVEHLAASGGSIVNIASVQSFANEPGMSIYAATKAGVMGLTRNLALDFAPRGVRVNAVCPGAVYTGMTEVFLAAHADPEGVLKKIDRDVPLGRMGRPEDIAPAVYFLASPDAAYITGTSLIVDGGVMARIAV
ncbi:MAG: SDR family oxidoreductase [Bryobacteraceae bacterium]